jgi:hypothetical protein
MKNPRELVMAARPTPERVSQDTVLLRGLALHPAAGYCQLFASEHGIGWREAGRSQFIPWPSVKWTEVDVAADGTCLRIITLDEGRQTTALEIVPQFLFPWVRVMKRLGIPVKTMPAASLRSWYGIVTRGGPILAFAAALVVGGLIMVLAAKLEAAGWLSESRAVAVRLGALGGTILVYLLGLVFWSWQLARLPGVRDVPRGPSIDKPRG